MGASKCPNDGPDAIMEPLDTLIGYRRGMVLPEPRSAYGIPWDPDKAWSVRPTEDTHWSWVFANRDAATRRTELNRNLRAVARRGYLRIGRIIARKLIAQGKINMDDIHPDDRGRAEDALAYVVSIIKDPKTDKRDGLAAARTILDFTRPKPAAKSHVTVSRAEDFLTMIEDDF